jgi:hypothetical protein
MHISDYDDNAQKYMQVYPNDALCPHIYVVHLFENLQKKKEEKGN